MPPTSPDSLQESGKINFVLMTSFIDKWTELTLTVSQSYTMFALNKCKAKLKSKQNVASHLVYTENRFGFVSFKQFVLLLFVCVYVCFFFVFVFV